MAFDFMVEAGIFLIAVESRSAFDHRHKANHLYPRTEVKNAWNFISTP
jgi:hypothetical protein